MTIKEALQKNTKKLEQKKISYPGLEAELLLASAIKSDRVFLLTHPEKKLTIGQKLRYHQLINLKIKNWPTAYLTGQQEFFGLNFVVNKHTLIPRPETELLVESALKLITGKKPKEVIEVGTGSGCIIISVAKNALDQNINYSAIEISQGAIKIAKLNAQNNSLNQEIRFIKGSLLTPIIKQKISEPIIILANLPYLTPNQFKSSPSIWKEPLSALVSGVDGLDLYRQLINQTALIKAEDISLILEIDPAQTRAITQLIRDHWPDAQIEVIKDFRNDDRLIIIQKK